MARFAQKQSDQQQEIPDDYKAGFSYSTDDYAHISEPGLTQRTVEEISHLKEEPAWMLERRLKGYQAFEGMETPSWGADLSAINYDEIRYYLRATDEAKQSWDDVPDDVRETFDKLGIPEAERSVLSGVKAQYDSEVVYGSLQNVWKDQGVEFMSMDEALVEHEDLVKEYFGRLIPAGDNKFAALNTATWSGGSFVYVPPGVEVKMPLQTYFRINAENAGQFERTLIIVDEGAKVHYIEGCFVAGVQVMTDRGNKSIEEIQVGERVLTHEGHYRRTKHIQKRPYSGDLYTIEVVGRCHQPITATEEHPFLTVSRKYQNERNTSFNPEWKPVSEIAVKDYLCYQIDTTEDVQQQRRFTMPVGTGGEGQYRGEELLVDCDEKLFRLIGYYLAEGSISGGSYLNFSFHSEEHEYIEDVKQLLDDVFGELDCQVRTFHHSTNNGTTVRANSVWLCRFFQDFGTSSKNKRIPSWVRHESREKQKALLVGLYRGDGNYYNQQNSHGRKELFRISTI